MITFVTSAATTEQLPVNNKPHVALVGRSNVGKSSFINHLANQKQLAHSSSTPGRTRLMNVFDVDGRYQLIDLPGYGYAVGRKSTDLNFDDMIGSYLETPNQKLILLLIDARIGTTDLDGAMIQFLQEERIAFGIVVNKMDKLKRSEQAMLKKKLTTDHPFVSFFFHSIQDDASLGDIKSFILKHT